MEKLEYTKELIRCWVEAWGEDSVYVAFSGGLDSTVLLHIVRDLYPNVPAVFNNTGLELPEIASFVRTFNNVVELRPKVPFHKVIQKFGWPVISKEQSQFIYEWRNTESDQLRYTRWYGNKSGKGRISGKWQDVAIKAPFAISHKCCDKLKKEPAKRYEKQSGRHPMLGMMKGESALRAQYGHSCNAYDKKRPTSNPLTYWTKQDVWDYIQKYSVPYCSVYDKGWERTGCIFCLFGIHQQEQPNRLQLLSQTHPKLHSYCLYKLGAKEVLDYIGVPYE